MLSDGSKSNECALIFQINTDKSHADTVRQSGAVLVNTIHSLVQTARYSSVDYYSIYEFVISFLIGLLELNDQ